MFHDFVYSKYIEIHKIVKGVVDMLKNVFTFSEACKKWGINDTSTLRHAVRANRFRPEEYKQSGSVWLITKEGMEREYGKMPKFEQLQFVYDESAGIRGLGIVHDIITRKGKEPSYNVMYVNMDEDFGTWDTDEKDLSPLTEEEIRAKLNEVLEQTNSFGYFIVQLNDIPQLSDYHLEESDYVKGLREIYNEEHGIS